MLRPQELGLVASLGLAQVLVQTEPRVALLSTGDEVVEPGDARKPGQIYDANRFSLRGLVEAAGGQVSTSASCPISARCCERACSRPRPRRTSC